MLAFALLRPFLNGLLLGVLFGAVAGIMISQYLGQDAPAEVRRSFFTNLWLGFGLAGAFTVLCLLCPGAIMRAYTAASA